MLDWNLALIDVCAAWVCVALPRMAQARLLQRWGDLGFGQESRLRPDPVQHMSLVGTIAVPAATSLFGIPVIAWGKDFDFTPVPVRPVRALAIVLATAGVYAAQALAFVLLMKLLAVFYLAGAPVAARAGQLSLRLAALSILAPPLMDSGLAWRFLIPHSENARLLLVGLGVAFFLVLFSTPLPQRLDGWAQLGYFYLAQLLP